MTPRALLLGAIAVVLGLSACSHEKKLEANPAPAVVVPSTDPMIVQVDHPEQYPLVPVESRRLTEELETNGTVAPDVSRNIPVNALISGRAMEVSARLGDEVKKGQVLLKILSSDMAQAISDYHKFQADKLLARRSFDRAKTLFERGAIAEKDLQVAEDIAEKARADVEAIEQRIRILGGDLKLLSPIITITSPASGTIIEQNITGGGAARSLDASPNLFTIADLSKVWVLCDVYENNLAQVKMGDTARVKLNAYPEKQFQGRVSNISRILDPATRTAKVRLELDNQGGLFRPGMFAAVTFKSQTSRALAVVPTGALLRLHDRFWVFKPIGAKTFRRTEVQAGPALGDGTQEILSGLQPNEKVVAQALQFESAGQK